MFSVSAAALLCGSADSGFDIIVDFMIVLLVFRLLHMWVYLLLSVLWLLVIVGVCVYGGCFMDLEFVFVALAGVLLCSLRCCGVGVLCGWL